MMDLWLRVGDGGSLSGSVLFGEERVLKLSYK
jgi:hypothetical protein